MMKVNLEDVLMEKQEIPAIMKKMILGGAVVENEKASAINKAIEA